MRFVLALRALALPGGLQSFLLTLADHLLTLGHETVIFAPVQGLCAEEALRRGHAVFDAEAALPTETDITLATDKITAIKLAKRYPAARRLFLMHNFDEFWLPTLTPGMVHLTLAPNERLFRLAQGCVGAGRVARIRQPVDLYRFPPRGRPNERPKRILLLGNYAAATGGQRDLRQAWPWPDLEWRQVGAPNPCLDVAPHLHWADLVVGYGRSIVEAMAAGRPAFVHEHAGSDGWVTAESYAAMEADGFSGISLRPEPNMAQLRADFDRYCAHDGAVGHGLARAHHDARLVTADLVALAQSLDGPPTSEFDPQALAALQHVSALLLRANWDLEQLRFKYSQAIRAKTEAETS